MTFDLAERLPTNEELCECDSFDLSFLALTGHVHFVDEFDLYFDIIKAVKDEALWDPEADLMALVMEKAWKKHGKRLTDGIIAAFDLSGDISVSRKKVNAAFKKHKNVGRKVWKEVGKKISTVLTDTGQRSTRYFEKQQKKVLRKKQATAEDWNRYTQEALSDHVRAFTEEYPERVLHPAVDRLVKITEKDPLQRLIARSELRQRIEAIDRMPANYLKNATDVQAGRMWTYTGIQMAHAQQVTEYIIIAQRDRRTCIVCQRLDGKTFSVSQAHEKMIEHLSALCPGKGKAEVPEYCGFLAEAKRLPVRLERGVVRDLSSKQQRKLIVTDMKKAGLPNGERAKKVHENFAKQWTVDDGCRRLRGAQQGIIPRRVRPWEWNESIRKEWAGRVQAMEEYIDASPAFSRNVPLYRGMRLKREVFEKMKPGDLWDTRAMSSWSTDPEVAHSFIAGRVESDLIVKLEGGSPFSVSMETLTGFASEQEVVLSGRNVLRLIRMEKVEVFGEKFQQAVVSFERANPL